jgi:hypothetical protein
MATEIKPCSCCGSLPQLQSLVMPHSAYNSRTVIKYIIGCAPCANKHLTERTSYFTTFAWNKSNLAVSDWNNAVDHNNRWTE